MAAAAADDDHDMEDQSDGDEESKGDILYEGESQLNGQDVAESTTPTDYSLYDLPPRLAVLRQQIHDLDQTIELPKVDWEAIVPYMDNVWRKLKSSEQTETSQNVELYWCKLRKASNIKTHQPRPTPEGKQPRKRKPKEEKPCNMAMKVTYSSGALDKVTIQKHVAGDRHTHDLEFMDAQKRNSGIMNTARREAVRGFQPASIWWKMQTEPEKLEAAGGKFMKISDVRNVQYQWRQEHPDMPLKAHTGYNAARVGPRPGQPPPLARQKSSPQIVAAHAAHPQSGYQQPQRPPPNPQPAPNPQPYQHHHAPPPPGAEVLHFPPELRKFLIPYLPNPAAIATQNRPHVTLTWAQGLDGRIASSPGYRTGLSGPETKAMTHFLRSAHDAILIGVRTAIADDPGLNCRLSGAGGFGGARGQWQPRPIIIDPQGRLIIRPEMKILRVAEEGRARPPWIVVGPGANLHPTAVSTLKAFGGEYLMINEVDHHGRFSWEGIFQILYRENIKSIMIEGGGVVLSDLLRKRYAPIVDSVITTIAPTFLGSMGVQVTQETEYDSHRNILQNRLRDVYWQAMGSSGDAVICGRLEQPPKSNGILQGIVEMANADGEHERQQKHGTNPPPPRPAQQHERLPPINDRLPPPPPHAPHQHRPPPPPNAHGSPSGPPHYPNHHDDGRQHYQPPHPQPPPPQHQRSPHQPQHSQPPPHHPPAHTSPAQQRPGVNQWSNPSPRPQGAGHRSPPTPLAKPEKAKP